MEEDKVALLVELARLLARYARDPRLTPEKSKECWDILDDAVKVLTETCAGLEDYVGD